MANPDHMSYPIGLPFEAHGGRFFNHPALNNCVILQHANQTILDIACGLPAGPIPWLLLDRGGRGSRHPLGTDLAFHNAIRNNRTFTIQALIFLAKSDVNGMPGTSWKPLMQAAFWNSVDAVRVLLDRGAQVNESAPSVGGGSLKTALQIALDRRVNNYPDISLRERSEKAIKMLLDAGADIHVPPSPIQSPDDPVSGALTPFEVFLKPWQGSMFWTATISETDIHCLEVFIRKGANLHTKFTGFPCSSPSSNTFQHQMVWHAAPNLARLIIDHASAFPGANGSHLLHEIIGSCPEAKRHPAETLRDIDVLLRQGADPNSLNLDGFSPIKICLTSCPGVDIVPRLKALLLAGADPESKDSVGAQPIVLAARAFKDPVLSEVMEVLISKFRGRDTKGLDGFSTWDAEYFPISNDPTFEQVLRYTDRNGDLANNMRQMLPGDVHEPFQKAAFSVASQTYLNNMMTISRTDRALSITTRDNENLLHIIHLRDAAGLPEYKFDQRFVLGLIASQPQPLLSLPQHTAITDISQSAPVNIDAIASMSTDVAMPDIPNFLAISSSLVDEATPKASAERRHSISSVASNESTGSFFIPSTTQVRWRRPGHMPEPQNRVTIASQVVRYECASCNNGIKLTREEKEKHHDEHLHTLTCEEQGCRRRFCLAERG